MKQSKRWQGLILLVCLLASFALWGGVSAAAESEKCEHFFGDTYAWVTETDATCTSKGEKRLYCLTCSVYYLTEEISIDPNAHEWGRSEITKAATCATMGETTYYCAKDPSHMTTKTDVLIDPNALIWEWTVTKPATCMEAGEKKEVCARDPAHTRGTVPIAADPNAHVWGEWKTTKRESCEANGSKTRACTLNGSHTETQVIAALGHIWKAWSTESSATCTTDGKKIRYCTHNAKHKDERAIPATGHEWGAWKVTQNPTVNAEGIEKRVCAWDSKHTESRKIEKLPGIKLSDKTTVDLDGLMKWDEKIYPKNPVIRVNGKKLSDLSRKEKQEINENLRIMQFLTALYQNPWSSPHVMYEGDIRIEVDPSRLLALVNEASKLQKNEEARQEYVIYQTLPPTPTPKPTPTPMPTPKPFEVTIVFKKEEEKVRFAEDNRNNDKIVTVTHKPTPTPKPSKKCLTPDTLIALADGSEKRVDELTKTDRLRVWDFEEGCLSEAAMTFYHSVQEEAPVLRVSFSDGTSVGVVGEHVFFDLTERAFVSIVEAAQEEQLKGHRFAKLENGQITEVTLTGIREDGTTDSYYSPVTEVHFNCFANGMLNISGFMQGFYNVFDLEEDALKYDAENKTADLAASGEATWEYFSELFPRELFERNRVGWLSVSVDKGLISAGELYELFDFCIPHFVGAGAPEVTPSPAPTPNP